MKNNYKQSSNKKGNTGGILSHSIKTCLLNVALILHDIGVDNWRHFLTFLKKYPLYLKRFVCHLHQKQESEMDKIGFQPVVEAQGFEEIKQLLYSGNGVGVYQGEVITIQQWALSNPPQWVIGKYLSSDAHLFGMDTVCYLLQTALSLAHHLQSASSMTDLQNPSEISLLCNCPHAKQLEQSDISFSEEYESSRCPLETLKKRELKQANQEYPQCPFKCIIELLDRRVNHNGKEPNHQ